MEQSLKQSKSQSARLSVMGACAVLFMLGSAQAAFAQQTASPKSVASAAVATSAAARAVPRPAVEEEVTAKPAKAGGEGIKIHGHWKIVVKNPDGTVASTTEFENALVTPGNGDVVLAQLLAGQVTWGGMDIRITGTSMCANACVIAPGSTLGAGPSGGAYANVIQYYECNVDGAPACFPGMTNTVTPPNSAATPPTGESITLQGSFTETTSEQINAVGTNFVGCISSSLSTVSASSCFNQSGTLPNGVTVFDSAFTSRSGLSVSAVPNQVVTVVVTISFS
jgi:hypothetical protein